MKAHPAASIFPFFAAHELNQLAADIEKNGQKVPIVMHEGLILDGRNRWRACEIIGIDPITVEWDGEGSPIDFVISTNLHRRHLDESQRAMVGAKSRPLYEREAKERRLAGNSSGGLASHGVESEANLPATRTRDKAADLVNVSARSVESASRVLDHGVPELVEAVERGEVAVSAAAEVAKMPKTKQSAVVAAGPAAVRAEAKQSREAKKPDDGEVLVELKKLWKKASTAERSAFMAWV